MSASSLDKLTDTRNAARPNSARVSSGRSGGGTTLACDNLAGWPTASKVHFVTYRIDSNSNPVAGTQLDCSGIVSGNNIGSLVIIDGTDTGNSINDVVEMLPTAAWGQDLADALTSQHTRTGAHKSITNTGGLTTDTLTVSGASTLTGGTTLPAGDIGTADLAAGAVTPEKLLTGAGTSWPWQSWTPTFTNVTVGNGTHGSRYVQIGKTIIFQMKFTFGSTSAMGNTPYFTLPVAARASVYAQYDSLGQTIIYDDSAVSPYNGPCLLKDVSSAYPFIYAVSGSNVVQSGLSSTTPMTWTNPDTLHCQGFYEAA